MLNWADWIENSPSIAAEFPAPLRTSSGKGNSRRGGKAIIHRDQIHRDVIYDQLSVQLLNTETLQRLGRIYQLGYSHLVFRGGTHTRLSHVMGAAHVAGMIVDALRLNYSRDRTRRPKHAVAAADFLPSKGPDEDRWDVLRHLVVWAALLHDVGHVPLGHTLEDEFEGIFQKHDDFASPRSLHLWGKSSEIFKILNDSSLYPESFRRCQIEPLKVWQTVMLVCYYKDIEVDKENRYEDFHSYLKYRSSFLQNEIQKQKESPTKLSRHKPDRRANNEDSNQKGEKEFVDYLLGAIDGTAVIYRPFLTDIVANTICADYLDYVRRDPLNVGLDVLRDDRILSHFYVSTEPKTGMLRMALALLDSHGKPRLDVCTGVVEQVRQRYRFAETIYYHKTKVSASAMFARAMSLIGKPAEISAQQIPLFDEEIPLDAVAQKLASKGEAFFSLFKTACEPSALMHPEVGDETLHMLLMQKALLNIEKLSESKASKRNRETKDSYPDESQRSSAIENQLRGIALLQGISRRRLYKASISINAMQFGRLTKGASPKAVVEERLKRMLVLLRDDKKGKNLRARIEADMAKAANMPAESILLYVPPRKSQAKGIETFAFDTDGVVRLNEHPAVAEKVNELGRDYQNLWRLLVITHPGYQDRNIEFSEAIDVLVNELWSEFNPGSERVDLHDEVRISTIREISRSTYIRKDRREAAMIMRNLSLDVDGNYKAINWDMFERAPILTTTQQETITSNEYAERAFLLQCAIDILGSPNDAENMAIEIIRSRYPSPGAKLAPQSSDFEIQNFRGALESKKDSIDATYRTILLRAFELQMLAEEVFLRSNSREAQPVDSRDTEKT